MSRDRPSPSRFTLEPISSARSASVLARRMQVEKHAGRVLLGPKKLAQGFARIVANRDGSGRIESFDPISRTWIRASESITFSDVWSAPPAAML